MSFRQVRIVNETGNVDDTKVIDVATGQDLARVSGLQISKIEITIDSQEESGGVTARLEICVPTVDMLARGEIKKERLSEDTKDLLKRAVEIEKEILAADTVAPKVLKDLGQWNAARQKFYLQTNDPRPNGLACPCCGAELLDSHPRMTLSSYPPQKDIYCKCGFRGHRIA